MKNIHVLPTVKPTNLLLCIKSYIEHKDTPAENSDNKGNFRLGFGKYANKVFYKSHHMYITSDEEIKEGDWFIREGSIHKCFRVHKTDIEFLTSINSVYCGSNTFWSKEYCKKIILTTDQDLIKDGVQSIDDEFLEWFVKNSSCEEVDTDWIESRIGEYNGSGYVPKYLKTYLIVIPKEEPNYNMKQEILAEMERFEEPKQTVEEYEQQGLEKYSHELKQETLEEFAERFVSSTRLKNPKSFIFEGAKWQQERSYSEFESKTMLMKLRQDIFIKGDVDLEEWFEQFKKK